MEEEAHSAAEQTASEYISHHLTNLSVCYDHGEVVWNHCEGNFLALHVDTFVFSILLGIVFCALFGHTTELSNTGKPGSLMS